MEYNIAICGATGLVGRTVLKELYEEQQKYGVVGIEIILIKE